MRSFCRGLAAVLFLAMAANVEGAGPADPLLKLLPPDAGLTFAIENLRGRTSEFFESPLVHALSQLPGTREWLSSERVQRFQKARAQIERVLGEPLTKVRDDLFGEAVVLALRVPPDVGLDQAKGILLTRTQNRALLDRLIDGVNKSQQEKGELLRVRAGSWKGHRYWIREFAPREHRPNEYYTILEDRTFVWTNSEELGRGALERQTGEGRALGSEPRFQAIRSRLPDRSVLSLFINPRFVEAVMASAPKPAKPEDVRIAKLLSHYVSSLEYAGGALEWRDGLVLHVQEAFSPNGLAPALRRWAARAPSRPQLERVPGSALGMAAVHVDFDAAESVVRQLVPIQERQKYENLLIAAKGALLGRNVKDVLPALGPGVLAYLDAPDVSDWKTPASLIVSVELQGDPGDRSVAAALDNGLRMVLALAALTDKRGEPARHLESCEVHAAKLSTLRPMTPFAFAIGGSRLVLGRSFDPVSRALDPTVQPADGFAKLRAREFPRAESFACVDLVALSRFAEGHRDAFARRLATRNGTTVEEARKDLENVLSLVGLFQDAFFVSEMAPDARSAHRMLGVLAKPAPAEKPTP